MARHKVERRVFAIPWEPEGMHKGGQACCLQRVFLEVRGEL